jgi:hypothetical protein
LFSTIITVLREGFHEARAEYLRNRDVTYGNVVHSMVGEPELVKGRRYLSDPEDSSENTRR